MDAPSIGMIPSGYKDGKLYSVYPLEGLGEELVENGKFDSQSEVDYWQISGSRATKSLEDGFMRLTYVSTIGAALFKSNLVPVGRYKVTFRAKGTANTNFSSIGDNGSVGNNPEYVISNPILTTDWQQYDFEIELTQSTFRFYINPVSIGATLDIDDISIKEDTSADFDFVRGSLATRINAQGLVEDVNIISEELTQNGNFDEIGSEEVSNGDFSQEGSEEIINGSFDTDSDWTLGTGWSIADGKAVGVNASGILEQSISFTENKIYKISFSVLDLNSGSVAIQTNQSNIQTISSNGDYEIYYTSVANDNEIRFNGIDSSPFNGSIDNISCKEVGQDWTFGTGWSMGDGKAVFDTDDGDGTFQSTDILTLNNTYRITFDVNITDGVLRFESGAGNNFLVSSSGTYTHEFKADLLAIKFRRNSTPTRGYIDNISVKEVGQNWIFESGWNMGDNKAVRTNVGSYTALQQNILTSGRKYRVILTVDSVTSGEIFGVRLGNDYVLRNTTTAGTYVAEGVASSATLSIMGNPTFEGSVSSISVKEITDATDLPRLNYDDITWQDALSDELITNGGFYTDSGWTKGTGWSIEDGKAVAVSGTASKLVQDISGLNGKYCKVSFTLSNYGGSGSVKVDFGTEISDAIHTNGFHEVFGTYDINRFELYKNGGFEGSIDNVSVKEFTGQEVASSGCPSLLLESQSTNTATYSNDFTQGDLFNGSSDPSLASSVLTSEQGIAPDGTNTAQRLTDNNDGGTGNMGFSYFAVNLTSGQQSTVSIFVKKYTLRYFVISFANYDTSEEISFDLDTNTINRGSGVITEYGNGWYRCSATFSTTTDTVGAIGFYGTNLANVIGGNLRDGTKSVLVWGLQCEELPYVSSYIPTNGSVATRLKDQASRSGISNLINSDEGVLYAEIAALADDETNRAITLSDGTNNNVVEIFYSSGGSNRIRFQIRVNGVGGDNLDFITTNYNVEDYNKIAIKYKLNDAQVWVNGTKIHTDSDSGVPNSLSQIDFNYAGIGSNFYGKVKDLRVYTTALSDEDLQYLTS